MVVKKVKKQTGATKKRPSNLKKQKYDTSKLTLPEEPKPVEDDLGLYTILVYGREKSGKSTWCGSFPDALFLATEPGLKGMSVYSFNNDDGGVKNWDIFRTAVALLQTKKAKKQFKTIIIDTVDNAYSMCMDWVCDKRGIEYPGKDSSGKQDYGKSWRAVKVEFTEQIRLITDAGYGMVFTSHLSELDIETPSGATYTRIIPSMSKQARSVVEALVDFFFCVEYVKDKKGNTKRILICEGDEAIWAGARAVGDNPFPQLLELTRTGGYEILEAAFHGENPGLDPRKLAPSKLTTGSAEKFIKRLKLKGNRTSKKKMPPKKKKRR